MNTFGPIAQSELWIGLNDPVAGDGNGATHAADFVWTDGEPVTYTNWYSTEPNNDADWAPETHGEMFYDFPTTNTNGHWNDSNNTGSGVAHTYGVVEVVPEPATLFLLAGALPLAMIRRRRRVV